MGAAARRLRHDGERERERGSNFPVWLSVYGICCVFGRRWWSGAWFGLSSSSWLLGASGYSAWLGRRGKKKKEIEEERVLPWSLDVTTATPVSILSTHERKFPRLVEAILISMLSCKAGERERRKKTSPEGVSMVGIGAVAGTSVGVAKPLAPSSSLSKTSSRTNTVCAARASLLLPAGSSGLARLGSSAAVGVQFGSIKGLAVVKVVRQYLSLSGHSVLICVRFVLLELFYIDGTGIYRLESQGRQEASSDRYV